MSESIERHTTTVATSEDGTVTRVTHTSVRVSAPVIVSTPNVAATSVNGH